MGFRGAVTNEEGDGMSKNVDTYEMTETAHDIQHRGRRSVKLMAVCEAVGPILCSSICYTPPPSPCPHALMVAVLPSQKQSTNGTGNWANAPTIHQAICLKRKFCFADTPPKGNRRAVPPIPWEGEHDGTRPARIQ